MTATAEDRLVVSAANRLDAQDIARRQWESFGFRIIRVIDVQPTASPIPGRWRVDAEIEVVRS